MNPIETSIKKKIQSNGVQLKDWNIQINYGIKTGFNDAFIISKEKKDELIAADPKSAEIIRPLILLNTLGDVNNDKQADTKDVSRIRNRFSADLANNTNVTGYDVGGLLNRYRICDVNKDRAVNLIDANNIRAKKMIQFYTNDGGGA